jgi:cytidylate kinase
MQQPTPGGPALAKPLVIAIDGPAGAGKSTVSKLVAARLGMLYLDTGAMYRAATVRVLDAGLAANDADGIAALVTTLDVDFGADNQVRVDGVTMPKERIRSPATTAEIWRVANNPRCRAHLVNKQQAIVAGRPAVVEGRDATTVICPDAQLKVYLDASPEERARRRLAEWKDAGIKPTLEEVATQIRERDRKDTEREVGALTQADDALPVVTDGLSVDGVVARIMAHAVQRQPFILERFVADQLTVGRSRSPGYVRVAIGDIGAEEAVGWQLGLTNPEMARMPGQTTDFTRNQGGRQAGVICQGRAVLALAGRGAAPDHVVALPMLPQTWYVIEPGAWHAVIQAHGTICAWAESSGIVEEYCDLTPDQIAELAQFVAVYIPK